MTREEKIEAIYKDMANKDLSFGCKVKFSKWIYTIINKESVWSLNSYVTENWAIHNTIVIEDRVNSRCYLIEEIIWHPVMIGNVIEYIRILCEVFIEWQPIEDSTVFWRWRDYKTLLNNLIFNWYRADLPIDDQTDECIDFVYSLIKKS